MADETEQTEDEEPDMRSEVLAQLSLQMARNDAYRNGTYELDEWEGFHCTECDWRGLSAPMHEDMGMEDEAGNVLVTQCPVCGARTETAGERTKWSRVLEKLVNGPATVSLTEDE